MKLNIDGYYEIGKDHKVCEDYVLMEKMDDNFCWGVVCDGCSGSISTDIGARIIAHHIKKLIRVLYRANPRFFEVDPKILLPIFEKNLIPEEAEVTAKMMALDPTCLNVSILIVFALKKEDKIIYSVIGWGDGSVIIKKNEKIIIKSINAPFSQYGEAPYYLRYYRDPKMFEKYEDFFPGGMEICTITMNTKTRIFSDDREKRPCNCPTALQITSDKTDPVLSISISSDGLKTYNTNIGNGQGSLVWAAERAVDYKSVAGVFVERNMKFFSKMDRKDGINHYDDVSMVTVVEIPEEVNEPKS